MASYKIVKQQPQPGFLQGLAQGIPQGASTYIKNLLPAIMKQRKETEEEEEKNAYIEALKEGGFEQEGATIGPGGISQRFGKPKEDTFLEASRKAGKGEMTYDALKELFPAKLDEIAEMQFNFSPVSQKVINNIKGPEDIEELRQNAEEYEKAGVDVQGILQYLKVPRVTEPDPREELGRFQKFLTGGNHPALQALYR